ncbi:MAG: hypothetical protein HPY53_09730 [Brevinematales bacterium]|nr:hypothetical protein [Brevinematales bacterium]
MDKETIQKYLDENREIQIIFYENDETINQLIRFSVDEALKKYNKPEFAHAVYGCIKELVINATKANLKRAFFQKNNYDINNMGQYVMGLTKFKGLLDNRDAYKYFADLRTADLWVMFTLFHNSEGLRIEVVNNTEIIEIEETRIRMKLKKAMHYTDIALFYQSETDNSEGAGMGIALLVILMQSVGLDPSLFRIGSKNGMTVTRIEVPFDSNYKSVREK